MSGSGRAPAIIAHTSPFRLVLRDSTDTWSPTWAEVQSRMYDYTKLHRLTASFDIGLPHPHCLHISFDGSLLLPKLPEFWPIEKAVATMNQILGEILLGGIYFDVLRPTDVDRGFSTRPDTSGRSAWRAA